MARKTNETMLNDVLGKVLRQRSVVWAEDEDAKIETQGRLLEGGGEPDILVTDPKRKPVVIETKYDVAPLEVQAQERLGKRTVECGELVETVVMVHWPKAWKDAGFHLEQAEEALRTGMKFRFAVWSTRGRWPEKGWVETTADALAANLWAVGVYPEELEALTDAVAKKLEQATCVLGKRLDKNVKAKLKRRMREATVDDTLNAMIVMWLDGLLAHEPIARIHDVPGLEDCVDKDGLLAPRKLVEAWDAILKVNYEVVYEPAQEALRTAVTANAAAVKDALKCVREAKEIVDASKVGTTLNVGSELLPVMAGGHRKQSAAFYTLPVIAELLAQTALTVPVTNGSRFADLACGSGTLVRAGYRRLRELGSVMKRGEFHRWWMEECVRAIDISRMAAHLTASSLTLMEPGVTYEQGTRIGHAEVGNPDLTGSLELFERGVVGRPMEDSDDTAELTRSGKGDADRSLPVLHGTISHVLMNPPYSRTRAGQSAFDLPGLTDAERNACQKRLAKLQKQTCGDGKAGMASSFVALWLERVASAVGEAGFVLPSTMTAAQSWTDARRLLEQRCGKLATISGVQASADTGMGEVMLVARRSPPEAFITHVNVKPGRPVVSMLEAREIGRLVLETALSNDAPVRGEVKLGDEVVAKWHKEPRAGGLPWVGAGVWNLDFTCAATMLRSGQVLLADNTGSVELECGMATIQDLFHVGPSHDSIGHLEGNNPRGAFEFVPYEDGDTGDLAVWHTDAKSQKTMLGVPTHTGRDPSQVAPNREKQAKMRNRKGHVFFQRGLRYTSQGIAAAWTEEPHYGGAGWVSGRHEDPNVEKCAVLWGNSTPGLMLHWANAQRQHSGRGTMQVTQTYEHHFPDLAKLPADRLAMVAASFEVLKDLPLMPVKDADNDPVRKRIDNVVADLMSRDAHERAALKATFDARRKQLCMEPQVQGK